MKPACAAYFTLRGRCHRVTGVGRTDGLASIGAVCGR